MLIYKADRQALPPLGRLVQNNLPPTISPHFALCLAKLSLVNIRILLREIYGRGVGLPKCYTNIYSYEMEKKKYGLIIIQFFSILKKCKSQFFTGP